MAQHQYHLQLKRIALSCLFSWCVGAMAAVKHGNVRTIKVDSTALATQNDVMDIISQVSGISLKDGYIYVDGRGQAVVFVDDRKLNVLTELWHIPASRVADIQIVKTPSAAYDKSVRAAIVVHLKPIADAGLSLNDNLAFAYTDRFALSNDLSLDWKRDRLTCGAFAAWEQDRVATDEEDYTVIFDKRIATGASKDVFTTNAHAQLLTLKGNIGYELSPLHRIAAAYSFQRVPRSTKNVEAVNHYDYKSQTGVIDFDHPVASSVNPGLRSRNPRTRHELNAEYRGYISNWTLSAGTNLTFEDNNSYRYPDGGSPIYLLTDETITRSYVKATLPVGTGAFDAGVEYDTDDMDFSYDTNDPNPEVQSFRKVHSDNANNTLASYVSLSQTFGGWTLSAGMRYEGNFFSYKPYDDDGVMKYLDYVMPLVIDKLDTSTHIFAQLWQDRKLAQQSHHIYPTLSMSTNLGKSTLSLSHTISYRKASLAISRITLGGLSDDDLLASIIRDEKIYSTVLDWHWQWLGLNVTHNSHLTPFFTTAAVFNAEDYDDVNLGLAVSPKVGIWSPSLSINLHKQWLDIDCAEPHKLHRAHLSLSWTNNIRLPYDWLLFVKADWHSKGAVADLYYNSTNFSMDAYLQKLLLHKRLSVKLQVNNVFRQSYNDVTAFSPDVTSSVGFAIRNPRTLTLSLSYHL